MPSLITAHFCVLFPLLLLAAAFALEQRATGIADLQKMVNNFIETEDRNFGMFRYIQVRGQQEAMARGFICRADAHTSCVPPPARQQGSEAAAEER